MSANSLLLVSLIVDSYDRAKAFYCDALGFDCLEDTAMPDGKRWLVVRPKGGGGASLLLAQASDDTQRSATRPEVVLASFCERTISPATIRASWVLASSSERRRGRSHMA